MFVSAVKVVDEYNRREQEIKHLEKELEDKTNALNAYRQNISEVMTMSLQSFLCDLLKVFRKITLWVCFCCRPRNAG